MSKELWNRARSEKIRESAIYIIGGKPTKGLSYRMETLKMYPFGRTCLQLPRGITDHGTAFIGSKLYIIGGLNETDNPTNVVSVFDVKTQSFYNVESINEKRYEFGAATVGGKIYVCGGTNEINEGLESVESYCPIEMGTRDSYVNT